MTIIVPFANQKGGVAKTTSAVTFGHGLANEGLRTLIIDTDPQGHVAFALGLDKSPAFYRLIVEEEPLENVLTHARPNLDIVAGDKHTEKVRRYVIGMDYREEVLAVALKNAPHDLVLLDLAPSLDVLHVAALVAADWLLIPTKLDAMAVDGVNEILKSYAEVNRRGGHIQDFFILPTFFDRVTRETVVQLKDLVKAFGNRVWPPIPVDTKIREAAAHGQTLWEYAPASPALIGYVDGDKPLGGYQQAIDRLQEVIHAG